MALNVKLITFNPATLIKSADVNTNFANINNASVFYGGVLTINAESGHVTSDGNGNLRLTNGRIGQKTDGDICDGSGLNDVIWNATSATGVINFVVGNSSSAQASSGGETGTVVAQLSLTDHALHIFQGGLLFSGGSGSTSAGGLGSSITRLTFFTGNSTGTYNHGNGAIPDVCWPTGNANVNDGENYDTPTATQVHITSGNSQPFRCSSMTY